jgi:TatD DNase family protein
MKYIDIHCHLDSEDYDLDRDEVLARMKEREIGAITIGADLESSKRAVEIAEANENIWVCIGIHPEGISPKSYGAGPEHSKLPEKSDNTVSALGQKDKALETVLSDFSGLVQFPKVVGIGECGLDYFHLKDESEKINQKELFESQIQFALKCDKPLMLHIRDAYGDALEILENYKKEAAEKLRGNIHFFAGDVSVAKIFLDLEFTMSFTGVITFTHDYDEVIKYLPIDSIMSETDAPFVAPIPFRGKRNEPAYVAYIVKKMAEIRAEDETVLNNAIINNAKKVFGL